MIEPFLKLREGCGSALGIWAYGWSRKAGWYKSDYILNSLSIGVPTV